MENFAHIVLIDSENKLLKIYRLFDDSRRELFTECSIDGISAKEGWEEFNELARMLGENILLDSPLAREIMEI